MPLAVACCADAAHGSSSTLAMTINLGVTTPARTIASPPAWRNLWEHLELAPGQCQGVLIGDPGSCRGPACTRRRLEALRTGIEGEHRPGFDWAIMTATRWRVPMKISSTLAAPAMI